MAERLYFTSNAFSGPVYPADSNWNDTTQCTTQSSDMVQTPSGDAPFSQTAQKNSAADPHSIVHIRYKFPLAAGVLFTGNIRGQHFCQCPGTLGGMRAISVRIFDSGTTVQATLLQDFSSSLFSGFSGTQTNRFFPPSTAMATTYTTVAGDVLVVELGTKWFTPSSGGTVTSAIRFGDNGVTDLPVDETTGVGAPEQNSWIEFENVSFEGILDDPLPTFSGTLVAIRPATPSKEGLHFFDRSTNIESIWNGTVWREMVSSLNANGGTQVGGNITFADTTDIDVTLTSSTFTWNAQALSAETNRANYLRLTDSGTEGCLLTATNTFAQNFISFAAPNRVTTHTFGIGRYGNVGSGTSSPTDLVQLNFTRQVDDATTTLGGIVGAAINSNTGAGNVACRGVSMSATASMATAAGPSAVITAEGMSATCTVGSSIINNFQGTGYGGRYSVNILAPLAGVVAAGIAFETTGLSTRAQVTDWIGWHAKSPTVLVSGTFANEFGGLIDAQNRGTSQRIGMKVVGATGGTSPSIAYGFWVTGHATGTTRRSFIGDNSMETIGDYIVNTNSRGLVLKDTVSRFWRLRNNSVTAVGNGTIEINEFGVMAVSRAAAATGTIIHDLTDLGTTIPAT